MNSPKQARPSSKPKAVTFTAGGKPMQSMSSGRCTPSTKTKPAPCNCGPKG